MDSYNFNRYNSPIINQWSEEVFYQPADDESILSFSYEQDIAFAGKSNKQESFEFDWLIETDRRHQFSSGDFVEEDSPLFPKKDRSQSLNLNFYGLEQFINSQDAPAEKLENVQFEEVTKTVKKDTKVKSSKAISVKSTKIMS